MRSRYVLGRYDKVVEEKRLFRIVSLSLENAKERANGKLE